MWKNFLVTVTRTIEGPGDRLSITYLISVSDKLQIFCCSFWVSSFPYDIFPLCRVPLKKPVLCQPPIKFTSFPFRGREPFLSDSLLHRRERRGDIFQAFALGVDAEEPSHQTPENHHPGS